MSFLLTVEFFIKSLPNESKVILMYTTQCNDYIVDGVGVKINLDVLKYKIENNNIIIENGVTYVPGVRKFFCFCL